MNEVVITGATRTPVGSFNGSLSSLSAADLGAIAILEALKRSNVDAKDVDEVVLGQVLTAATGMNPARQALLSEVSLMIELLIWLIRFVAQDCAQLHRHFKQ